MDKLISKLVGLGVPAVVLVIAMGTTGLSGAAAITAALASLGPFGMLGGIGTLGVITIISQGLSEYGFDAIFTALIKEFFKKGKLKAVSIKKFLNTQYQRLLKES